MTVNTVQTNEHDNNQEDVRKKRDSYCRFGGLNVARCAAAEKHPFITKLPEGSARKA